MYPPQRISFFPTFNLCCKKLCSTVTVLALWHYLRHLWTYVTSLAVTPGLQSLANSSGFGAPPTQGPASDAETRAGIRVLPPTSLLLGLTCCRSPGAHARPDAQAGPAPALRASGEEPDVAPLKVLLQAAGLSRERRPGAPSWHAQSPLDDFLCRPRLLPSAWQCSGVSGAVLMLQRQPLPGEPSHPHGQTQQLGTSSPSAPALQAAGALWSGLVPSRTAHSGHSAHSPAQAAALPRRPLLPAEPCRGYTGLLLLSPPLDGPRCSPDPRQSPLLLGICQDRRLPSQRLFFRFVIKANPGRVPLTPLLPPAARTQRVPLTHLLGHTHGGLSSSELRTTVSQFRKTSCEKQYWTHLRSNASITLG